MASDPCGLARGRCHAAAVLWAALSLAFVLAPPAQARQWPTAFADRVGSLPSGVRVAISFAPARGVAATTETGSLAVPGHPGSVPGQTLHIPPVHPAPDSAYRPAGTLKIYFSRPVRDPRLHIDGLGESRIAPTGRTDTLTRLTVTGGTPEAPTLVRGPGWGPWTVTADRIEPPPADSLVAGPPADAAPGPPAPVPGCAGPGGGGEGCGTVEMRGTLTAVMLRIDQASSGYGGSTTPPAPDTQIYTVSLSEDLGTAPEGYGNASHVVSDLFLGGDVTADGPPGPGPAALGGLWMSTSTQGGEAVPGRLDADLDDADPHYPLNTAIGDFYDVAVPVTVGPSPATLAGWIDFDHNGRFDPVERAQADVPPGADTADLEWTVPEHAVPGPTWARLRMGRDAEQLVSPSGFADSGEVEDQRIWLAVGAPAPRIVHPVAGTATSDPQPEVSGRYGAPGSPVAVLEGTTELCRTTADQDGDWSCRPDQPLAEGSHRFVPVRPATDGSVVGGEEIRVDVDTHAPAAPLLDLPAHTRDPLVRLSGTGEPGSTVTVSEQGGQQLCSTTVREDGSWQCLPVEKLAEGAHPAVAEAVDAAGNRATGPPVELVVDPPPSVPPH